MQVQFQRRYPGLRLAKIAILTAVTRFRETGSVYDKKKKNCPPSVLTADKLDDARGAPRHNLHKKISQKIRITRTASDVLKYDYFSTPEAVGKPYLRPCDNRAVHELKIRIRQCDPMK